MPSIYIINPKAIYSGYADPDALGDGRGFVINADLTTATIAAMVPAGWDIRLTDEQIDPIVFDTPVDFVAITGKSSQQARMIEIATEFRGRGAKVLIGGPLATLDPEPLRPHADIFVQGEIEELAPRLFAELAAGTWSASYDGGRADITLSPLPRWDLYPVDRAEMGALQTTRGCPFKCEFCDVIAYQGRKQRHKTEAQVLAELDELYRYGFRSVFLVDDNFTVHRQFARSMLKSIAQWNDGHADDPVRFVTQASADIARDDEMLALCAAAGLRMLFVGVETNNVESLLETGKNQNLLMPIGQAIDKIVAAGMSVRAAFVVGFDHDGVGMFDQLLEFAQTTPIPDWGVNALTASVGSALHARLKREGRVIDGIWDTTFDTNIIPKQMTRQQLTDGIRMFARRLYAPAAFEQRMLRMIELIGEDPGALAARKKTGTATRTRVTMRFLSRTSRRGPAEARMVQNILAAAEQKPSVYGSVLHFMSMYEKMRFFFDRDDLRWERPDEGQPNIAMALA